MKSINDIEIFGTIGLTPVQSATRGEAEGRSVMQIVFPIVWQPEGQEPCLITASAISATAHNLMREVLPGEPLQFTGTLDERGGELRMRVVSVQRYVTLLPTIQVQGKANSLFALQGGESHVVLRGHTPMDSTPVPDSPLYRFMVKHEAHNVKLNRTVTQMILTYGPYPTRAGQAISVRGQYVQSLHNDHEAYILAHRMYIGERTTAPANLSIRDPSDRLQLDRIAMQG